MAAPGATRVAGRGEHAERGTACRLPRIVTVKEDQASPPESPPRTPPAATVLGAREGRASAPESSSRIPPAASALGAFAILALVDAGFIVALGGRQFAVRLWHHVIDAGHLLATGAVVAALLSSWHRFGPRGRTWAFVALAAAGVALSFALARDDFAGFAYETGGAAGSLLLGAMVVAVGVAPAAVASIGGRLVARLWLLALALGLAGVGVAVVNGLVLRADYHGVHLFASLCAASALATALNTLPLPARARRIAAHRLAPWLPVLLAAVLSPTVFVRPNNKIRGQLTRVEGAILVPLVARSVWTTHRDVSDVPPELKPWFVDRRAGQRVPPTGPSLLPADPIILLIGIDSLRADLFDKPEARAKMPNLLAMKARALDFTLARSPGARTITTWSSVFAGRYSTGLKWTGDGNRLSIKEDRTKRFSDYLREEGVETSAFISYGALGKDGLCRNFDRVVDIPARKGQSFGLSADVVPEMLELLKQPHRGPRFVFAHWMDPHYPYDAAGVKRGPAFDRFLSEVELADQSLGALWEGLERLGLLGRTALVVTADHGEAFGQHDTPYHTVTVYDELIRVPLFIVIPGVAPRKIDTPVSLMDLGPTLMDLFSVRSSTSFLGESLVPFARGESPKLTRPIGAERSRTRTLVFGNRKAIIDDARGRQEIYDLDTDPEELQNKADELGPEGERLLGLVDSFFDAHALNPP